MDNEKWDAWGDIHTDPDQQKRIARAYKADCTPLSISEEDCTGIFQGSHGRYATTLTDCNCVDFKRRKIPCKHMYRLAIDLGLFGNKSQAKSDQFARKVPKGEREELAISMISRIENYPDEIQVEIKKILLDYLYHNHKPAYYEDARKLFCTVEDGLFQGDPCRSHFLDGYIRKLRKDEIVELVKTNGDEFPPDCKKKEDMINWVISNTDKYGEKLLPYCLKITPTPEMNQVALSIYKYLHRKFDEEAHKELFFDPEDGCTKWLEKGFPDDFETGLLNLFGTNPLTKSK